MESLERENGIKIKTNAEIQSHVKNDALMLQLNITIYT